MTLTLRIVLIVAMLVYFAVLLTSVRKRGLNLKYVLLWLLMGIVLFILILFPNLLTVVSGLLGFRSEMNALLSAICFFIILLEISLTAISSRHNAKLTRLVQQNALLEKRIEDLEKKLSEEKTE